MRIVLTEAGLHFAMSPNLCAVASLDHRDEVSIGLLELPRGADTLDDAMAEAVMEAFVLHFSAACKSSGNHQTDLLAVLQQFSEHHPGSQKGREFLHELYRANDTRLDHAVEPQPDWLFMNNIVQRSLGTQLAIGYRGTQLSRSLPTKIAQGLLQIRCVTLITTYNIKRPQDQQQVLTDSQKADTLREAIGVIHWFTSLMGFIVNELFRLAPSDDKHNDYETIMTQESIQSAVNRNATPALFLLLLSLSRLYLKYAFRNLRQYTVDANSFRSYPSPLRDTYQTLISTLRNSPVQMFHFEKMFMELDQKVKEIFQSRGLGPAERLDTEKAMLIDGTVPEILMPAVTMLLTTSVERLREEVDVAELYFSDFSWLDLGGEDDSSPDRDSRSHDIDRVARNRRREEKPKVDAVRMVLLKPGARIKQCVRCCSVIEDAPYGLNNRAMQSMIRTCPCGDWWAAVGEGR